MSFAFPSTPEEGTLTVHLHDEIDSAANWWFETTDPSDVYIGPGDKWNANAASGGGVQGYDGYLRLFKGTGTGSWVYLRSNAMVPSNGAQIVYDATSTTYAVSYSNRYWMGLMPDGYAPTAGPRAASQYVVMDADRTYIKGSTGVEQTIVHGVSTTGSTSAVRGFRIYDGAIHYINAAGAETGVVTGLDLPDVEFMNPIWGIGQHNTTSSTGDIRLDWVDVGSFSMVADRVVDAPVADLSISTGEASVTFPTIAYADIVDVSVDTFGPVVDTTRGVTLQPAPAALSVDTPKAIINNYEKTLLLHDDFASSFFTSNNWTDVAANGSHSVSGGKLALSIFTLNTGNIDHSTLYTDISTLAPRVDFNIDGLELSPYFEFGFSQDAAYVTPKIEISKLHQTNVSVKMQGFAAQSVPTTGAVRGAEYDGSKVKLYSATGALVGQVTVGTSLINTPLRGFVRLAESTTTQEINSVSLYRATNHVLYRADLAATTIDTGAVTVLEDTFYSSDYHSLVMADGPVAYYTAHGETGFDLVGERPMALNNVGFGDGMGIGNKAFEFNGVDSYGQIGGFPSVGHNYTFEAWFKMPSGDAGGYLVRIGGELYRIAARGEVSTLNFVTPGYGDPAYGPVYNDGHWHHVVLTPNYDYNGSRLIVDGESWSTNETFPLHLGSYIGGYPGAGANFFNGFIDNIAFYDRYLTDEEVIEHYNLGIQAIDSARVHVYHTAAHAAIDVSANEATLDLISSPTIPVEPFTVNLTAAGHGVHTVDNVELPAKDVVVNVSTLDPVVTGNKVIEFNASPSTMDVSVGNAQVLAADSVSVQATITDIDVTFLHARGGDPNKNMLPEAANITLLTPNGASAVGGHDEYVSTEATMINIEINDPSVSNMTDVLIQADKIGVDVRLVGFYNREEDKWADFVESTTSPEQGLDVWHRFHETSGVDVIDERGGDKRGKYHGSPTLNVTGMLDSRVGVRLGGGADWIETGLPAIYTGERMPSGNLRYLSGYSQELMFRTTDTGHLLTAGAYYPAAGIEVTDNGVKVWAGRYEETMDQWNINKKVNDGQWHQVLWFQEDPVYGVGFAGGTQWTLMIDGEVVLSRAPSNTDLMGIDMTNIGGGPRNPYIYALHGDARDSTADYYGIKVKNLAMDVMEFVHRAWSGFSRDLGTRSWRIISGHTLIDPGVAQVSVSVPNNSKAKGNAKKMLVLFGWTEISATAMESVEWGKGKSSWSGMNAPGIYDYHDTGRGPYGNGYPDRDGKTTTADFRDYKVTGVQYDKPWASDPGIVKPNPEQFYMNDITGVNRFIDFEKDLAVDITDFDVIHVLRWPTDADRDVERGTFYASTSSMGERRALYKQSKDAFIDTIMKAVDKGVGLWVADPRMAVDLGIAEGYDEHPYINDAGTEHWYDATVMTAELDRKYAPGMGRGKGDAGLGLSTNDNYVVKERRIVSTATDFSEYPTSYFAENFEWADLDRMRAHADVQAMKLTHRPNGLTIGSRMAMAAISHRVVHFTSFRPGGIPRTDGVTSLRGNVVGQIIAKEQESYFRGKDLVPNPYAENVTTVLLEKGTILNGKPIGGRIFVETMDNYTGAVSDPDSHRVSGENLYAAMGPWGYGNTLTAAGPVRMRYSNGQDTGRIVSTWDVDSRREKETFMWFSQTDYSTHTPRVTEIPYIESGDSPPEAADYVKYPYMGMNDRGLKWLGANREEVFGQKIIYAAAVETSVEVRSPEYKVVKHVEITTTAAEARVELRRPQNIPYPDVEVIAYSAKVTVIGGSYQRIIEVGPAEVSVRMSTGHQTAGEGEDFVLYLRNNDITLYLGED